ncbi:hypothetical protein P171DRAFT_482041 [Karstenula rhodostoma CBS 690.94]|uniref:Uncharacterized protein n=1 Tax=Karstenula rhodostoma CBS 690.94 TaxID=1392251 RepID=A0A9P4PRT7_9PLEO|nr:hypothetical protein P171DRAFT_482041 [Karstenula rhodostoma CBS 690.94]
MDSPFHITMEYRRYQRECDMRRHRHRRRRARNTTQPASEAPQAVSATTAKKPKAPTTPTTSQTQTPTTTIPAASRHPALDLQQSCTVSRNWNDHGLEPVIR